MILCCHVGACPWRSLSGFCNRPLVIISSNGLCSVIYDNQNMVKPNWQE